MKLVEHLAFEVRHGGTFYPVVMPPPPDHGEGRLSDLHVHLASNLWCTTTWRAYIQESNLIILLFGSSPSSPMPPLACDLAVVSPPLVDSRASFPPTLLLDALARCCSSSCPVLLDPPSGQVSAGEVSHRSSQRGDRGLCTFAISVVGNL